MYSYTGSFTDSAIGKTTAETMYNSGADIIFTAAGGVNAGVIEAAKTERLNGNEVWVIGVDRDMYEDGYYTDTEGLQQSLILTSATKMVGTGSYNGIKASMSDTWVGGTTVLTYENNGVGVPAENPNLDQAIVDEAAKALSEETDLRYDTAENVEEIITINVEGDL
jgi:basic membrane protein A